MFLNNFAKIWNVANSSTVSEGGFYSSKIGEDMYIVNFNSLLYDNINIFNLEARIEQWIWFENTLATIKNMGGYVWIVNHICPYSGEAGENYTKRFINIVSNYRDIIIYQFYGHVHSDTFTLLEDNVGDIVGFCSVPSSLMLDKHEASFRIYKYDVDTYDIYDYDQYVSNLELTIQYDNIIFTKSYSFNSEYNLDGVHLKNWIQLYNRIEDNTTILNRYYKNLYPGLNNTNCDSNCKRDLLNDILPNKTN